MKQSLSKIMSVRLENDETVGHMSKIDPSIIHLVRKGYIQLSQTKKAKIAEALGVGVNEIAWED